MSEERPLCACGCGRRVIGANAVWINGAHARKKNGGRTAQQVEQHEEQMATEPMRGECLWCNTAYTGSANQVIAALRDHRTKCATWLEHDEAERTRTNRKYNASIPERTVQLIVRLMEEGLTHEAVAAKLNAEGPPRPNGDGVWGRNHINQISAKQRRLVRALAPA